MSSDQRVTFHNGWLMMVNNGFPIKKFGTWANMNGEMGTYQWNIHVTGISLNPNMNGDIYSWNKME